MKFVNRITFLRLPSWGAFWRDVKAGVLVGGKRERRNTAGFLFFHRSLAVSSAWEEPGTHCKCAACVEKNSPLRKPTFYQIAASQQSMTNKATTASLSFLHPSVHQQIWSNKYANSSFVFLIFCHCLLWQQPLPWGQQENRIYWTSKRRWQPANSITKPQLVKELGTQVIWFLLLTAQILS